MNAPFLVYVRQGCPHCDRVVGVLIGAGMSSVLKVVDDDDPVVIAGMRYFQASFANNQKKLVNAPPDFALETLDTAQVTTPLIVSFATQEVIIGANLEQLSRSIALVRRSSSIPSEPVVNAGEAVSTPANGQAAQ